MYSNYNRYTNLIYEALLRTDYPHASLILRALNTCYIEQGQPFLVKDVMWSFRLYDIPISKYMLYQGLNALEALGLVHTHPYINRKRGRPATIYALLHPEDTRKKLGIKYDPGFLDQIPIASLNSLRNYRAAMHREFVARYPGQHSRAFLAERLGVSPATIRNYEKGTDIEVIPQWGKRRLTYAGAFKLPERNKPGQYFLEITGIRPLTDEEMAAFLAEISPQAHGVLSWDNEYNRPMKEIEPRHCRAIRFLAQEAIRQGLTVHLKWRETNYYRIRDDGDLPRTG
jgi:transcriptional regulator with XRE-family HTH domain